MLPLQFHLHIQLDFQVFLDKDYKPQAPSHNTFHVQCSIWDVNEPRQYLKRVGHEVPSVVAVLRAVSSGWGGKMLGILAQYCQGPNEPNNPTVNKVIHSFIQWHYFRSTKGFCIIINFFLSLFAEISHLFFAKENDWGFSHFVTWNVSFL